MTEHLRKQRCPERSRRDYNMPTKNEAGQEEKDSLRENVSPYGK